MWKHQKSAFSKKRHCGSEENIWQRQKKKSKKYNKFLPISNIKTKK